MNCVKCGQDKETFKCDQCRRQYCKNCSGLTSSEIRCVQLKERKMLFWCDICTDFNTLYLMRKIVEDKEEEIRNKDKIIGEMEKRIRQLEEIGGNTVEENSVMRNTKQMVVVKPRDESQSSNLTRKQVREIIEPSELSMGVMGVRQIQKGGIAIACRNEKPMEEVCEKMREKLGEKYEIKKVNKKKPRIRIFDVDKEDAENEDELKEKIMEQNKINNDGENTEVKILFKYDNKQRKGTNVVIETDRDTYAKIMGRKELFVGWRACRFGEYVNVIQCFKCWKFGHMSKECRGERVCQHCTSKEHGGEDCNSSEKKCVNCKYAAEILKIKNIRYDHSAKSRDCESYRRTVMRIQEKTDYPILMNKSREK